MIYIKSVSRMYPVETMVEWQIGEGDELKKLIGVGFYKTIFIKDKEWINFYYDYFESKRFEKALEDIGEEEFDKLCDNFLKLVKNPNVRGRDLVPYLTIFNEFDEYPEYMESFGMQKRLLRVREETESFVYELFNRR